MKFNRTDPMFMKLFNDDYAFKNALAGKGITKLVEKDKKSSEKKPIRKEGIKKEVRSRSRDTLSKKPKIVGTKGNKQLRKLISQISMTSQNSTLTRQLSSGGPRQIKVNYFKHVSEWEIELLFKTPDLRSHKFWKIKQNGC